MIRFGPRSRRTTPPHGVRGDCNRLEPSRAIAYDAIAVPGEAPAFRLLHLIDGGEWQPVVDVADGETHVTVFAEIPGIDKRDIRVEVEDGLTLTLRGEKRLAKLSSTDKWWCCESSYGTFARVVDLPSEVHAEIADAKIKDGVLTIRLPKLVHTTAQRTQVA
jgi:HSP20 family molecular chaperone IbpA